MSGAAGQPTLKRTVILSEAKDLLFSANEKKAGAFQDDNLYLSACLGNYRERLTRIGRLICSEIKSRDNFSHHNHFPRYLVHKYTYN